ncbi:hypothetical protein AB75_4968 [Escherichia coli 3-105-05_S1_C3]|nr:hypothetical protein AB75_4968 [Escherichia coli 3-105-05_S1_C3]
MSGQQPSPVSYAIRDTPALMEIPRNHRARHHHWPQAHQINDE